jgi:ATP-dependent Lon protease
MSPSTSDKKNSARSSAKASSPSKSKKMAPKAVPPPDDSSSSEEEDEYETEEEEEEEEKPVEPKTKKNKNKKPVAAPSPKKSAKKNKKPVVVESSSESEDDESTLYEDDEESTLYDESEEDDDDEEEDSEEEEEPSGKKKEERRKARKKEDLIILLNMMAEDEEDYSDEDYDSDDDEDYEDDDENDSPDEKVFMGESYQEIVSPPSPEPTVSTESSDSNDKKKNKKNKSKKSTVDKKSTATDKKGGSVVAASSKEEEKKDDAEVDIEKEYANLLDLKKQLSESLSKRPDNKILRTAIDECNADIRKLIQTARKKNTKDYRALISSKNSNPGNEVDYFKTKMSYKEQMRVMADLREVNKHMFHDKPYRLSLLQSTIPPNFKAIAMQKLNALKNMNTSDSEYHKIKTWVDTFMKIPFGQYKNLSVKLEDGLDVCNNFLEKAKTHLDDCVYGLEDAKLQIMQMLGQWITNPAALGTAIAIKGPAGSGKTTLVKEGISKILGREFAFIALGGAGDGSFLEGHSYTYEGSLWGKIVQILIDSKCMNPIIYFDELDKVSDSARGQEIIGILTHLTDTSQNNQFHDKYFSEIDFDLSKCLFIFSYNDENLVNPILKDRMYRIQTKSYDSKEKGIISRQYLLPKIQDQVKMPAGDIIIPDDTIQYIIQSQKYTKGEAGVRNLKRCLEIIYTKLNLFRLVKPDNPLFSKLINIPVAFPFTVERKHVDILVHSDEAVINQSMLAMYV